MKKSLFGLIVILLMLAVAGCEETFTTSKIWRLPNLSGLSEASALDHLNAYPYEIDVQYVANNDLREDRFFGYGDNLQAGDVVPFGSTIVVYFIVHENRLPDLTGLDYAGIFLAMAKLDVVLDVQTVWTNDVQEGLFVSYAGTRQIGDLVPLGAAIVVYVAQRIIDVKRDLMISGYAEGSNLNRALELYNPTDESVDLSEYAIRIYEDGAETNPWVWLLGGSLGPKETYALVHPLAEAALLNKADVLAELPMNGNDAVALVHLESDVEIDLLGTIGWGFFYLHDRTLVRQSLVNAPNETFASVQWDIYAKDHVDPIGRHPVSYPVSFTFDPADLTKSFDEPGGMVRVYYSHVYDGDTAYFTPGFLGDDRVRFIGVDTPELSGGSLVAYEARDFVQTRLQNASVIYLQHDPPSGNRDTYARNLALIWVDGVLLNWEIVKKGYSQNNYQDETQALVFSGVTLARWMTNAEIEAKAKRLGVWI
jgi:endonuclease YncB( thermonuclease family)